MMLSARVGVIELAADEVRLAIVKTGGKLPKVLEMHRAPVRFSEVAERSGEAAERPGEAERSAAYAAALSGVHSHVTSHPALYVWCASSAFSIARQLNVPFKGARRVSSAVQFELEPYLAFPIDDLVVRHVTVREVEGETQVLALGIRRDYIEQELEYFEAAAVNPEGIGLDALGLAHLWDAHRSASPGLHAVLHVRERHAVLTVKADKRLAFVRHIAVPAARFHENPQGAAKDIQKLLRAFSATWGSDTEMMSLSVSGLRLFDDERALFEAEFQYPTEFVNLMQGVAEMSEGDASEAAGGIASELHEQRWAACVGVALGAAGAAHSVDFQTPGVGAGAPRSGLVRHAVFSAVLLVLAIGGYVTYTYMDYRANLAEVARLGDQVWEEFRQAYPNSESAQQRPPNDVGGVISMQRMQEEADTESSTTNAFSVEFFSHSTLLDVLSEFATAMPDDKMGINDLKLALTDSLTIDVGGEVKDIDAFAPIIRALEESDTLEVNPNVTRSSERGKEIFKLKASQ